MLNYFINIATSISQFGNTILGGNPDMTISARAYLNKENPKWWVVYATMNKVFFWQDNHCYESHLDDIKFAKEILESLKNKKE